MIIDGASEMGSLVQPVAKNTVLFDEAIGTLLRFSLVQRKRDEHTFSMHRLVQAILRSSIDPAKQRQYAENMVKAINLAFPDVKDCRNWSRCQQYLPHAQICVDWIDIWNYSFNEAGRLLYNLGYYLYDQAQYQEAEPLFKQAIAIGEKALGPDHPDLAVYLNDLALLYKTQGKYKEAEQLFKRAIAIGGNAFELERPGLAIDLNNLANLYKIQGKYEEAEPLYQRAIAIDEKMLGLEHPQLATHLYNLALLYQDQKEYEKAELLLKQALEIRKQKFGPTHPYTQRLREKYDSLLRKLNMQKG